MCFGHDLTSEQRELATAHLGKFLRDFCCYDNPKVHVWSRNNLASFLKLFPSLSLRVNGRAANFQTHSSWATDDNMQLPFVAGDKQQTQIAALQQGLRQYGTHIRITGEPGIGKTRLVFEATKVDDLNPLVIYCDAKQFYGSSLMFHLLEEDNEYYAIVILDECDPDHRARISSKFRSRFLHIRLVTIDTECDYVSEITYIDVPLLDDSGISEIIHQYHVPMDQARKWATVCGGSPRVAHLVGRNLQNNPDDILRARY